MGELDEGCQKVQTFSYELSKYQECKVQHNCMLYMKVVKTVNPKSCHHKEKYFVLFLELHMYISW